MLHRLPISVALLLSFTIAVAAASYGLHVCPVTMASMPCPNGPMLAEAN